ncbi:outer membrane protein assembly factor BamE domain-containing protein [Humitalea sp. 24SJ18S-53]|uniref:outer membrane protein assembly factor BamE domain-containing protein n=1 Tax=Humitalea sp. 24SJ18S-53 TaxID=3422307 RepID=UPI003D664E9B
MPLFAAPPESRGHFVAAYQLAEVVVGTHTRADVQALLGSPTTTATFDDDTWYYISAVTRLRPARTPALEDQRVVVVTFDRAGVVQGLRELERRDGRQIDFVSRETPVPGTDRTFMQSLLGNIGRLGAGPGGGAAPGPGSGTGAGR